MGNVEYWEVQLFLIVTSAAASLLFLACLFLCTQKPGDKMCSDKSSCLYKRVAQDVGTHPISVFYENLCGELKNNRVSSFGANGQYDNHRVPSQTISKVWQAVFWEHSF